MRAVVWRELAGAAHVWRAHLVDHDVGAQVPDASGPIGAARRLAEAIATRAAAADAAPIAPIATFPPSSALVAARWHRGVPLLLADFALELRMDD